MMSIEATTARPADRSIYISSMNSPPFGFACAIGLLGGKREVRGPANRRPFGCGLARHVLHKCQWLEARTLN